MLQMLQGVLRDTGESDTVVAGCVARCRGKCYRCYMVCCVIQGRVLQMLQGVLRDTGESATDVAGRVAWCRRESLSQYLMLQ